MHLIAHKIQTPREAQLALKVGADFLETDVSKRILLAKFTTQHDGIKGKFGFGEKLEPLLKGKFNTRLFLDIKHAQYSLTFAKKFIKLLEKYQLKNLRICGHDWEIISEICKNTKNLAFYTLDEKEDQAKIQKILPKLHPPAGFSIRHDLIDQNLVTYCSNVMRTYLKDYNNSSGNFSLLTRQTGLRSKNNSPRFEVWAWTVNNQEEVMRLKQLKVSGIITDKPSILRKLIN